MGTNCQNQPEAHLLAAGAPRAAPGLAAPGRLFKAEAIVSPDDLAPVPRRPRPVPRPRVRPRLRQPADGQALVDAGHARRPPRRAGAVAAPQPAGIDGVGDLRALPRRHRLGGLRRGRRGRRPRRLRPPTVPERLLRGPVPGSFARGALFQDNPVTGDARISGSAASLCGIDRALALGDEAALELALRRLESMYAVAFSYGGIPLIYMGDEIAMCNDPHWRDDPAHADDNRWMHRPRMDWTAADHRARPGHGRGSGVRGDARPRRCPPVAARAAVWRS